MKPKRYTKCVLKDCLYQTYQMEDPSVNYYALLKKIGRIEDIEQELGIDLIVLYQAMKDGIWTDHYHNGQPYHMQMPLIHSDYDSRREGSPIRVCLTYQKDGEWYDLEFKDYGKTWALAKEELEWK